MMLEFGCPWPDLYTGVRTTKAVSPREAIITTQAESLQDRLGDLACMRSDAIFAVAVAQWW